MGRMPEGFARDAVIRVLNGETWTPVESQMDVAGFLGDLLRRASNPTMVWRFPETPAQGFEIRLKSGGQGFRPLGLPDVNAHAPSGR